MRIVLVSDVSLGYGSPQVPSFARSLADFYGAAEVTILEPDEPDHSQTAFRWPGLNVIRIRSTQHPHSQTGRIEYVLGATRQIDRIDPDVLVLITTFTLPVVFRVRRRPRVVIYYQLEQAELYGTHDQEMNKHIGGLVDLIVYPEENRAALDMASFGDRGIPIAILYNCSLVERREPVHTIHRTNAVLYYGTIEEGRTYAEYLVHPSMSDLPLDIYGRFTGPGANITRDKLLHAQGHVRYLGFVDAPTLDHLRRQYAYSLVAWNPIDAAHLYACPNKFFEAIASGVPPITAPHPQCQLLVQRYQCGIVLDGWDIGSFRRGIDHALSLFGTPEYETMVANCQLATERELNWETQFAKLVPCLKRLTSGATVNSFGRSLAGVRE